MSTIMRSREAILEDMYFKKMPQANKADMIIIELLLDIRDQNEYNNGKKKAAIVSGFKE